MGIALLDRIRRAQKSGAWWEDPYWREPRYVGLEGNTAADIEEAFQALVRIYHAKWFRHRAQDESEGWEWWIKACRAAAAGERLERITLKPQHPVYVNLCCDGSAVVIYLLRHGRALVEASGLGLLAAFPGRLRDPGNFEGTWLELDLIYRMARAGVQVLPAAVGAVGNRRCEFLARLGAEELHIEAKFLSAAPENKVVSQLEDALHQVLTMSSCLQGRAYINFYEPLPGFLAEVLAGEGPKGLARRWPAVSKSITGHLEEVVGRQAWGHHEVPGILRYHVVPVTNGMSYQGRGAGLLPSKDAEIHKIVQRGIEEAGAQFPAGVAGLLVVHSDGANRFHLQEDDFRGAFETRPSLGGLVVLDRSERAQVIPNPFASTPISGYTVLSAILRPLHVEQETEND